MAMEREKGKRKERQRERKTGLSFRVFLSTPTKHDPAGWRLK